MCGIAGVVNKRGEKVNRNIIQTMNDVMAHRGPDAEGIYMDGNVGLGHRRLSIIDISENGTQPMFSADKRFVIIFNGEIYNYIELKAQLKKEGAKFLTDTDTEVIIEAYRHWGIECTKYFNGMWGLALYDTMKKQIFISRDRFGVKPLYIYDSSDEFIFASEIKSIIAVKPEQKEVDVIQVARYMSGVQEDMDEHTFYKNIHNFPKNHSMLYDLADNSFVYHKYWEVNAVNFKEKWKCINYKKNFVNY